VTSRPLARHTIRENGSPGMRPAGTPKPGSSDVAFDHKLIASPLARKPSACSKTWTSWPARLNAATVARPASPAPTIAIRMCLVSFQG
jgi:hypothetical protein